MTLRMTTQKRRAKPQRGNFVPPKRPCVCHCFWWPYSSPRSCGRSIACALAQSHTITALMDTERGRQATCRPAARSCTTPMDHGTLRFLQTQRLTPILRTSTHGCTRRSAARAVCWAIWAGAIMGMLWILFFRASDLLFDIPVAFLTHFSISGNTVSKYDGGHPIYFSKPTDPLFTITCTEVPARLCIARIFLSHTFAVVLY